MEINSTPIIEKKTLQLKSKKLEYPLEAIKIHNLPDLGAVEFDTNLKAMNPQWIEEASPRITLFKTTISRLLSVQIIYVILCEMNEKKENLIKYDDDENLKNLIENIVYVTELEWKYFQSSKVKFNFIFNLIKSFLNHSEKIIEIFEKHRHQDWRMSNTDLFNLVIPYSAGAELLIIQQKIADGTIEGNKTLEDRKKILICEYLMISEFFVSDEETKFIHAMLHKIFDEITQ